MFHECFFTLLSKLTGNFDANVFTLLKFVSVFRLVIPNTVEGIEVETRDPFNEHFLPEWKPYSEVPTELEDAYSSFDERN